MSDEPDRPMPAGQRACAFCGGAFVRAAPGAKYCSQWCREGVVAERREQQVASSHELACAFCGQAFRHLDPAARYCTHFCRRRAEPMRGSRRSPDAPSGASDA